MDFGFNLVNIYPYIVFISRFRIIARKITHDGILLMANVNATIKDSRQYCSHFKFSKRRCGDLDFEQ